MTTEEEDKAEAIAIALASFDPSMALHYHGVLVDETWPVEALLGMIRQLSQSKNRFFR